VDEAKAAIAAWLYHASAEKGLPGRSADQLSNRLIEIAARAGFWMGMIRIGEKYQARWTHPQLRGLDLPDTGLSANEEEARIRACFALLKVPRAARLLDHYRLTEI
jgi:hypothetical protein